MGVVKAGLVAKTAMPEPVSSVIAEARLALDGVARKVATPVPRPETPVEIGKPVPLVKVTEVGVPRTGVTSVGEVPNTASPDPVSSDRTPASWAEVVAAKAERLLAVKATVPVVAGRVMVTDPAAAVGWISA